MPHGAGHTGGGHHHGGGGFSHHHHHHHHGHRHSGYGSVYNTGGLYYRYGQRRRSLGWSFFWMAVIGVSITLAIIFSVRYGLPSDNSSDNEYAPNETRIITYSPIFCSYISISAETIPPDTSTVFSVLSKKPQLIDHDSFQFSETGAQFNSQNDYQYWSYYLYQGSTFGFSACKHVSYSHFKYYLIKGTGNFNSWVDHPKSSKAIYSNSISSICSARTNYTYKVTVEDNYYMVFYLEPESTDGTLDINFDVYRTKYMPAPESVLHNCSLDEYSKFCSVEVPMGNSYGLLSLPTVSDSYWSESSNIDVNCGARVWVYVVISVLSVTFFVVIMVCIMACCCYFVRRQRKKYTPLNTETLSQATPILPEVPAPTTAAYVTGKEAPPPYNPMYGGAANPPKYT